MPPGPSDDAVLPAEAVKTEARAAGFALVGLARAQPLDGTALRRWLAAGFAAEMAFMRRNVEDRLDPARVLPGCRTVLALAIPFRRPARERSPVAGYARGRDYHYAHRDRLKALRKRLLRQAPGLETYACVDTGLAMEKVWAERAGLGFIGKNGLLITKEHGSWVTLSVMFMDRAVDAYDAQGPDRTEGCGACTRCLRACPTKAFPEPGVVDARRCLAYHSIESPAAAPVELRAAFRGRVFGCDTCQDACPYNHADLPMGDPISAPRPIGLLPASALARMTRKEFDAAAPGTALARAGYDGLRRSALYALGASRGRHAAEATRIARALSDDPNPVVADAAKWTAGRLARR